MIQIIKQLYFRYKELINYVIVGGLTHYRSQTTYDHIVDRRWSDYGSESGKLLFFHCSLSEPARPISTDDCQYALMDLRSLFCLHHKQEVRF